MGFIGKLTLSACLFSVVACSDVTPQVMMLRGGTSIGSESPKKGFGSVNTENSSVIESTSISGYKMTAVVSKEDKATEVSSASGYKLILDSQSE